MLPFDLESREPYRGTDLWSAPFLGNLTPPPSAGPFGRGTMSLAKIRASAPLPKGEDADPRLRRRGVAQMVTVLIAHVIYGSLTGFFMPIM